LRLGRSCSDADRAFAALAVIALAQFMVIMETSIIGVALPEIQADVGFTPDSLSWVFNAYVIAFGGLLLSAPPERHGRCGRPPHRPSTLHRR
jgi:MFS family permease